MEIYLVRHGIAAEKGIYDRDAERPLTEKGIAKTTKVAQRLLSLDIFFNYILSSPLIRAYQTAEILKKVGLGKEITLHESLTPDGDIQLWLHWLSDNYNETHKIALIGHQPDLGNWAEMLVIGKTKEQLVLKKAGIIGIKITDKLNLIGNSELFLLTSPKWFI
jgi:phosphohistidine phosphatase